MSAWHKQAHAWLDDGAVDAMKRKACRTSRPVEGDLGRRVTWSVEGDRERGEAAQALGLLAMPAAVGPRWRPRASASSPRRSNSVAPLHEGCNDLGSVQALELIRDLAVVTVFAAVAGAACRRIGLSSVVGYLLAGIAIGPYTPPFQLVGDSARVEALAQLGLVFLVFSIGLGLSFSRLKRLGVSIALATAIGAIMMVSFSRIFGAALGWSTTESLFLAGMLVVSSSAIIAKVLDELNLAHERSGQLALGVTVLEDIVAVVMLTLLTPLAQLEAAPSLHLGEVVFQLSAFVLVLMSFAVLLMPRLLGAAEAVGGPELRNLLLAGIVLALAFLASSLGYSTALGAFILGAVVAGTRFRVDVERAFDTLRHIFGAIFFVAVGMLFDLSVLAESWKLVCATFVLVLVTRPLATAIGLIVTGNPPRDAARAGLTLTPIGEFSFIIAQLGVAAAVVPESFYAVAVGLSLGTSVVGPLLARHADAVVSRLARRVPKRLEDGVSLYHAWLAGLSRGEAASGVWRLVRPRLVMMAAQLLAATAMLIFAEPAYDLVIVALGTRVFVEGDVQLIAVTLFILALLAPIAALWRNLSALVGAFLFGLEPGRAQRPVVRRLVAGLLKALLGAAILLWVVALLPLGSARPFSSLIVLSLAVVGIALFARPVLRWHRRFEEELRAQFRQAASPALVAGLTLPILDHPGEWNLEIDEVVLPSGSAHGGKRILDLALRKHMGCSIVGIDRQGVTLANPTASEVLYPHDRLLLLGTPEQLAQAERFLVGSTTEADGSAAFSDLTTESVPVADDFRDAGRSLAELALIARFDVQVCGILREGKKIVVPHGTERILGGDRLLLLGTHDRIQDCRDYLSRGDRPSSVTTRRASDPPGALTPTEEEGA